MNLLYALLALTPNRQVNLYNSLTNSKTPLETLEPNKVKIYSCGPTVYNSAHVGNFRAFLTYDVLKRALMYFGYKVDHICNLTDVDDKIIKRCSEENISLKELTAKYEKAFMDDLELLNIIPARAYPRATEHIDQMVQLIKDLEANDLAYQSEEGSWYFNVANQPNYGCQLVQLDVANMQKTGMSGANRGSTDSDEYDADKVGVRDFALWKAYKPGFDRDDAVWDTGIGRGRPGWHLECSAMAKYYLGETIDVHCGGIDLKFPHHENEIAQSEGANNGKKFSNCWLHNGFVNIGDEKMSKSKGNFLTLQSACPTVADIRAYRYLVVSSQYRAPLSFTEQAMKASKNALKRLDKVRSRISALTATNYDGTNSGRSDGDSSNEYIQTLVQNQLNNFETALADDLSMPRASASLFALVKAAEKELKKDDSSLDMAGLMAINNALTQMDQVFGIFYEIKEEGDDASSLMDEEIPVEVLELVSERTAAKTAKDWALADEFRNQIIALGFQVKDVKGSDPEVSRIEA